MEEKWGVIGCDVYAARDGLWVKAGTMYPLGRLVYKSSSGRASAELVPQDAQVELEAKKAAGYYTPDGAPDASDLDRVKGRDLERF